MPTLSSIQGASLTPRTDIVENLRQGTVAGRQIEETRQMGRMDQLLQQAAQQQSVTGAAATPGAPAGAAPVTPGGAPGGAPTTPGGAPQRPQTFMDVLTSPELQQQMVQAGGMRGYQMAVRMSELAVQQQARRNAARQQQLSDLANISVSLRDMDVGAQNQALMQMRAESGGDPAVMQFVERMLAMPDKDSRDIALTRTIDRATTVSDSLDRRQEELQMQIDAMNAQAAQMNAQAAQQRLGISQQQANTASERLAFDRQQYQEADETERRALTNRVVEPVLDQAFETATSARETLDLIRRSESVLNDIERAGDGPVTAGLQDRIASALSFVDPALGDRARRALELAPGERKAALNALYAQTLQARIVNMAKAGFSDRDLQAVADTLATMDMSDTEKMRSVLQELETSANRTLNNSIELIDVSRKPAEEGGGAQGVMDRYIELSRPAFPNAPPVGTVEEGMRYVGGDPGQPSSWESVGG